MLFDFYNLFNEHWIILVSMLIEFFSSNFCRDHEEEEEKILQQSLKKLFIFKKNIKSIWLSWQLHQKLDFTMLLGSKSAWWETTMRSNKSLLFMNLMTVQVSSFVFTALFITVYTCCSVIHVIHVNCWSFAKGTPLYCQKSLWDS